MLTGIVVCRNMFTNSFIYIFKWKMSFAYLRYKYYFLYIFNRKDILRSDYCNLLRVLENSAKKTIKGKQPEF